MFRPIHPAEVVFGHVSDGSLPEEGEIHSHGARLVFVTTRGLAGWTTFSSVEVEKSNECALVHCQLNLTQR